MIKQELRSLENAEKISPEMVFRDPYFLDFLDLHDTYAEKDLENAIIAEMEKFILEIGTDFAFMARQKRITVDNEDYYIDLLFNIRKVTRSGVRIKNVIKGFLVTLQICCAFFCLRGRLRRRKRYAITHSLFYNFAS